MVSGWVEQGGHAGEELPARSARPAQRQPRGRWRSFEVVHDQRQGTGGEGQGYGGIARCLARQRLLEKPQEP